MLPSVAKQNSVAGAEGSCMSGHTALCPGLGHQVWSSPNVTVKLTCTSLCFFASSLVCEWHASHTNAVMFWLLFSIILWNTKGLVFYFHIVFSPYFGQVLFILRVCVASYTLLFWTLYPFLNVGLWSYILWRGWLNFTSTVIAVTVVLRT